MDADKQTIGHRSNIRVSTKTIKGGVSVEGEGQRAKRCGEVTDFGVLLALHTKEKEDTKYTGKVIARLLVHHQASLYPPSYHLSSPFRRRKRNGNRVVTKILSTGTLIFQRCIMKMHQLPAYFNNPGKVEINGSLIFVLLLEEKTWFLKRN